MLEQKINNDDLVKVLYRKLVLVEIERQLIKISCSLMEDEVYTVDDAVDEILELINVIELERQGIMSDIKLKG